MAYEDLFGALGRSMAPNLVDDGPIEPQTLVDRLTRKGIADIERPRAPAQQAPSRRAPKAPEPAIGFGADDEIVDTPKAAFGNDDQIVDAISDGVPMPRPRPEQAGDGLFASEIPLPKPRPDVGPAPVTGDEVVEPTLEAPFRTGGSAMDKVFGTDGGMLSGDESHAIKQKAIIDAEASLEAARADRKAREPEFNRIRQQYLNEQKDTIAAYPHMQQKFEADAAKEARYDEAVKREKAAEDALQKAKQHLPPTQTKLRSSLESVVRSAAEMPGQVGRMLQGGMESTPIPVEAQVFSSGPRAEQVRREGAGQMERLAEGAEKWAQKVGAPDAARAEDFSTKLVEGAASMGIFMAGGLAARAIGAPQALGSGGLGALQMGGQQFKEANDALKGLNQKIESYKADGLEPPADLVTQRDQLAKTKYLALYAGAGLGATEAIPIERFFDSLNRASKGKVATILAETTAQSLTEYAQEVGQQIGSNLVARLYEENRPLFKDVQESGAVAAILGGLMGFGAGSVQAFRKGDVSGQIPAPDTSPVPLPPELGGPSTLPPGVQTQGGSGGASPAETAGQPQSPETGVVPPEPAPGDTPQTPAEAAVAPQELPPAPAATNPEADRDRAVLRAYGYSDQQITDMSAAQRKAEVEDAVSSGIDPDQAMAEFAKQDAAMSDLTAMFGDGDKAAGTKAAPVKVETSADVDAAAAAAATEYSPEQGEANNRPLGHLKWNGLDGSVEVASGGTRRGTNPKTGEPWETTHSVPYGYWKNTVGADKMHVDAYFGPEMEAGHPVYVLDENDPATGKFRQIKTFAGFPSAESARQAYLGTSSKTPDMIGGITPIDAAEFPSWVKNKRNTTKPAAPKVQKVEQTQPKGDLSLTQYLAWRGGIQPDGDIRSMQLPRNVVVPGVGYRSLLRPGGMAIDKAVEAAREGGYLPPAPTDRPDDVAIGRQLLDMLDEESRGRKSFPEGVEGSTKADEERAAEQSESDRDKLMAEFRDAGVPVESVNPVDLAEAVRIMQEEGLEPDDALERAFLRRDREEQLASAQENDSIYGEDWWDAVQADAALQDGAASQEEGADDYRPAEAEGNASERGDGAGAREDRGEEVQETPGNDDAGETAEPRPTAEAAEDRDEVDQFSATYSADELQIPDTVGADDQVVEATEDAQQTASKAMEAALDKIEEAVEAGDRKSVMIAGKAARKLLADTPQSVKDADPEYWEQFGKVIAKMMKPGYVTGQQQAEAEAKTDNGPEQTKQQNYEYRVDNPGGDWLKYKQEDAEEKFETRKGIGGPSTAWLRAKPGDVVTLPTSILKKIPGRNGEARAAGDRQFDALLADVKKNGWENNHPIMIVVNHKGQPYITEGNTRVAVADAVGQDTVSIEINWVNGGEAVQGPFHPDRILPKVGRETRRADTEQTEAGEQIVLPGAEKATDADLAQKKADEPLKPDVAQKPADEGLFGDDSKQTDLIDQIKKEETKAPETGPSDSSTDADEDTALYDGKPESLRAAIAYHTVRQFGAEDFLRANIKKDTTDAEIMSLLASSRAWGTAMSAGWSSVPGVLGTENRGSKLEMWVRDGSERGARIQIKNKQIAQAIRELYGPKTASTGSALNDAQTAKIRKDLETKGAARVAGVDYSVQEAPNGGFYMRRTENGIRTEKGGGYPAKWSREKVIENILDDVLNSAQAVEEKPADGINADVKSIFDNIFAEKEKKNAAPKLAPAGVLPGGTKTGWTSTPPKKADLAKSAAKKAASGTKKSIDALGALFGGKNKLSMGVSFDPDTYAKAKPIFLDAVSDFAGAFKDIAELARILVDEVEKAFGWDAVKEMRPYLERFVQDVKDGTIDLKSATVTAEDSADEPASTGSQDQAPLENVPSEEGAGTPGKRDSERGDSGDGEAGPGGIREPEKAGVSGPRGGGSGAAKVRVPKAGAGSGRAGLGTRGTGRNGSAVSSEPASNSGLTPAEAPGNVPAVNFKITDEVELGKGTEGQKFRDNIDAIRALKTIEKENRRATAEEQRALARYVGWGGLANAFADRDGAFKDGWDKRGTELAELLTPEEIAAARRSTRNAHYTSETLVKAMWKAAQQLGFKGGLVLESSMGTGNFLGLMPQEITGRTHFVGIEYDSITSRIAKALYPQETILHSALQDVPLPDGEFTLNIGNPPFGSESLRFQYKPEFSGHSIHNQFFMAGLDALRPDGLQVLVVSRYLMDAQDPSARQALAKKGELLGAIRLPGTAFVENARTEVVTDVVFIRRFSASEESLLQKTIDEAREDKKKDVKNAYPDWVYTTQVADPLGGDPITVNNYFAKRRAMILGSLERSGSMRAQNDVTVNLKDGDLAKMLDQAIQKLPIDVLRMDDEAIQNTLARVKTMGESLEIALSGEEPGNLSERDGKLVQTFERETPNGSHELTRREITPQSPWSRDLYMNDKGQWYTLEAVVDEKGQKKKDGKRNVYDRKVYDEKDLPSSKRLGEAKFARLKDMVKLRDLVKRQLVLESQDAPAKEMEANRKQLAAAYKAFIEKHDLLNTPSNAALVSDMPDGALVMALEINYRPGMTAARAARRGEKPVKPSADAAPIMERRVVPKYEPAKKADSAQDAIQISMSERGAIDIDRIAGLLSTTPDEVIAKLQAGDEPLAFFDPESKTWETRDNYLSGQVVKKLKAARNEGLEKNIRALEAVQPEPWSAEQVNVVIGATWVPAGTYAKFAEYVTGGRSSARFLRATNTFALQLEGVDSKKAMQWGVDQVMTFRDIFSKMLNSQSLKVIVEDRDGNKHVDQEATALVGLKAREIENEFADWVFADGDRRNELVSIFNEKFNTRVTRQHDGTHLQLPGKVPDEVIALRRHQKNAVWRGIHERFLLLDHVVGAGKTFTAIARIMERRRMGLSRKPMVAVPNHLVEQWAADVYRLYPGAKVLAAGKNQFDRKNRRRLFAKIATGDWDIVIVPHSSFGFIGISPATETRFLENELRIAEEAIKEAQEAAVEDGLANGFRKPYNVKEAERLAEKIKARLDAIKAGKTDRLLTFEQMGVDDLTVDEAHEFKNLFYSSRLTGVRGMGDKTGSAKAFGLYNKVQVLRETPTGTVTFMTGTPISNSAVEMYTIMRYLAAEELRELGLEHFDAWRTQSVSAETRFEPTESGSGLKEVSRLGRSWSNMRALMELWYSFTDAVPQEDISKWYAEDNDGKAFPIPRVKGGGRKEVVVKPTPAQEEILKQVVDDFNDLPNITDPDERNATRLRLMDRARKLSLDARAVDPNIDSEEYGGKLDRMADEVDRIYRATMTDKGTQLVFLDRGVKSSKGDKAIIKEYDDLVAKRDEARATGDEEGYRKAIDKLDEFNPNEIEELRRAQNGGWNAYDQLKRNLMNRGIPAEQIRFVQEANNDAEKKALFDAVNDGTVRVLIGSTPRMGAGTNVQERIVAIHHGDVTWKPSDIEQREGRGIRQGNKLLAKYGQDQFELEILAYVTERTVDAKMWDLNSTKLKMINGIRKYDGSFTMDFEDDDAVGMAEIAALASGDPLLLERVKITAEIDKLELQERAHRRKQFGIEDQIDTYKKIIRDYPGLIEQNRAAADQFRPALTAVRDRAAGRSVVIEGKTYTSGIEADGGFEAAVNEQTKAARAKALAELEEKAKAEGREVTEEERTKIANKAYKYSVNVGGEQVTSKAAAEEKIGNALGDLEPFEAEVEGQTVTRRIRVARLIAEKASDFNANPEGPQTAAIGRLLGYDLELVVKPGQHHQSEVMLNLKDGSNVVASGSRYFEPGKEISAAGGKIILEDVLRDVQNTADFSETRMRNRIADAEQSLPDLLSQQGKAFPLAAELSEKRWRLQQITSELASRAEDAEKGRKAPQPEVQANIRQNAVALRPEVKERQADLAAMLQNTVRRVAGPQARVEFAESLPVDQPLAAWGEHRQGEQDVTAGGIFVPAENLIILALNDPKWSPTVQVSTAFHEAFHSIERHLLTERELGLMRAEDARLRRIVQQAFGFSDSEIASIADYEIRAMAFEHYIDQRSRGLHPAGMHVAIRRGFERLMQLFRQIRNALRGMGFQTSEDIFAAALQGEIGRRGATQPRTMLDVMRDMEPEAANVGSDAFARWFGNSKVVDAEGRPKVVYHGSTAKGLRVFDTSRVTDRSSKGDLPGTYFTDQPWAASGYTRRNGAAERGEVYDAYLSIQNPLNTTKLIAQYQRQGMTFGDAKRKALESLTPEHDGVIFDGDGINPAEYVVFNPEQIKSASRNGGAYDPSNPDIQANIRAPELAPERRGVAPPPETLHDQLLARNWRRLGSLVPEWINLTETRVKLQDRFLRVKRIQKAQAAETGPIPERMDAYLAESLFYGRAGEQIERLERQHIDPLINEIKKRGLSMQQVGDYLYALHAPIRNERTREINPDIENPSGMSDEEAAAILAAIPADKLADYQEIERRVRAIMDQTNETRLRGGLISEEELAAWNQRYDDGTYVPLRGFADQISPSDEAINQITRGPGGSMDVRGPESRRVTGRQSRADNPLVYVIMQAQEAIVRAEKDRVGRTMLRYVQANPNPSLWTVDTPTRKTIISPITGMVTTIVDPAWTTKPNVFAVKVGGKAHYITFKGPDGAQLARAFKNLDSAQLHKFFRFLGNITRLLARLSTTWNPDFWIKNFERDLGEAFINLQEQDKKKFVRNFLKYLIPAMGGSFRGIRGQEGGRFTDAFNELDKAGGRIRFFGMYDAADIEANVGQKLRRLQGGLVNNTISGAHAVTEALDTLSGSLENATRLAAYMAARDAGMTAQKAASIARELTVNFNRKGEWGSAISAAYMFANAAIQGPTRMLQAMKNKNVRRAAYVLAATGALVALWNLGVGGDDDDGEALYEKLPTWERDSHIIIMGRPKKVDGKYQKEVLFKFALPFGYQMFFTLGSRMAALAYGKTTKEKALGAVVKSTIDAFDPLGRDETIAKIAPTIIKPAVNIATNKNWTGRPINPENAYGKDHRPDSERYFDSASKFSVEAAKRMNAMTGGSPYKSGLVDVSPGTLDYMLNFLGGGAGRFVANAVATPWKLYQGEPFQPEKTPIVRQFVTTIDKEAADRQRYYEQRDEARDAPISLARKAAKRGEPGAVEALEGLSKDATQADLAGESLFDKSDRQISKWRAEERKIRADAKLSEDVRKQKIEEIRAEIATIRNNARKTYKEMQQGR